MESPANIVAIGHPDLDRAIAVLTSGFVIDGFNRWIFPEARDYFRHFPTLVGAFAGAACEDGTVFATEDFGAACVWMRPGLEADGDAVGKLIEEHVRPEIQEDLGKAFEGMDGYHHQADPCWYLPVIAVDVPAQGRGLGSALMKHALRLVDEDHSAAYLETATPANIPLYERFGFEIVGEIKAGSAPTIYPMVRSAR